MSAELEPSGGAVAKPGLIDQVERRILDIGGDKREIGGDLAHFPVHHLFTPGLYSRALFLPAGSINTSCIHKTEHPFVIAAGHVRVMSEDKTVVEYEAPFMGVTKPGTRRIVFAVRDSLWITFHPTQLTDLTEIENEIVYRNKGVEA